MAAASHVRRAATPQKVSPFMPPDGNGRDDDATVLMYPPEGSVDKSLGPSFVLNVCTFGEKTPGKEDVLASAYEEATYSIDESGRLRVTCYGDLTLELPSASNANPPPYSPRYLAELALEMATTLDGENDDDTRVDVCSPTNGMRTAYALSFTIPGKWANDGRGHDDGSLVPALNVEYSVPWPVKLPWDGSGPDPADLWDMEVCIVDLEPMLHATLEDSGGYCNTGRLLVGELGMVLHVEVNGARRGPPVICRVLTDGVGSATSFSNASDKIIKLPEEACDKIIELLKQACDATVDMGG